MATKLKKEEKKINEEIEWEKTCETELNFQKAVDQATGALPVKSEEDLKFMEKWIFWPFSIKSEKDLKIMEKLILL